MKNFIFKSIPLFVILVFAFSSFSLFSPSFDRQEEMHGYIRSGNYVIGNGIMVGIATYKVAFLTCRHVITENMLETNLSFVDKAMDDNAICINTKGRGFVYSTISNIDPSRWHFPIEKDLDFAWIILTDKERKLIAADGILPLIQLPKDSLSSSMDLITERNFPSEDIDINAELTALQFFSPVLGEGDASQLRYYNVFCKIPFFDKSIGITTRRSAKLLSRRTAIRARSNDQINNFDQNQFGYVINIPSHANASGSPVFGRRKDGSSALIGTITASNGAQSFFQTLDRVIPQIKETLEQ